MASTKNANNNDYIDLLAVARKVWEYRFLIIILALAGMIIMAVKVQFLTKDTYVASGILYVSNKRVNDTTTYVSQNDIDTSISMNTTYMEILKTRSFLTDISYDIDEKYSWEEIGSMVSFSSVNETQLMKISARAYSAEDAYIVADSIMRNAPDKLSSVFTNGEISVVDSVVVPEAPQGKGRVKKVGMGAMAGIALGAAIAVVMFFFDTKIHKSEDVAKRYNVSVLGEIAQ